MNLAALDSRRFATSLRRRLLHWFRRHLRDLPWRRTRDPYAIWISEVMLQQTQVATVVGYFSRFLERFPDVVALASASTQDVLRAWEGLGYYRRARQLHLAARRIVDELDGNFPSDAAVLASLPGLGRYTTNAVLSQAFDQRLPILETNSVRVLSRLFARRDDPRSASARQWLWQKAEELLPARGSGDFNQALMELGALVCTPRSPRCDDCPLRDSCLSRARGLVDLIPPPVRKPAAVDVDEVVGIVWHRRRVLLLRRPDVGRWAGLWEFPHGELGPGESARTAVVRVVAQLTGLDVDRLVQLTTLRHGVTHHRLHLSCWTARRLAGRLRPTSHAEVRWASADELESLPLCSPQRRLARLVVSPPPHGLPPTRPRHGRGEPDSPR